MTDDNPRVRAAVEAACAAVPNVQCVSVPQMIDAIAAAIRAYDATATRDVSEAITRAAVATLRDFEIAIR